MNKNKRSKPTVENTIRYIRRNIDGITQVKRKSVSSWKVFEGKRPSPSCAGRKGLARVSTIAGAKSLWKQLNSDWWATPNGRLAVRMYRVCARRMTSSTNW